MSDDAIARFRARVSAPMTDGRPADEGRVVLTTDALELTARGETQTIPLEAVFDFVVRMPGRSDGDLERLEQVAVGFRDDGDKRVATVDAAPGTIERFREVMFRVLLEGVEVEVARPGSPDEPPGRAAAHAGRLCVRDDRIVVRTPEGNVTVAGGSIRSVRRFDPPGSAEAGVRLVHRDDGRRAVTDVRFPSGSTENIFARFVHSVREDPSGQGDPAGDGTVTVLVVDDEPGMAEMVGQYLTRGRDDFEVRTATDAVAGLEAVAAGGVDCVISDYKMPRMNGLEFLKRVRESNPDLPFLLFTGRGDETVAARAISQGVTDYIRKSVESDLETMLVERVERAMNGNGDRDRSSRERRA